LEFTSLVLERKTIQKISELFLSEEFVRLVHFSFQHKKFIIDLLEVTIKFLKKKEKQKCGIVEKLQKLEKKVKASEIKVIAKNPKYNDELTDIFIEFSSQIPGKSFWIIPSLVVFIECKLRMIKEEYDDADKFEKQLKNLISKIDNMIQNYYKFVCGNNLPTIAILLISNRRVSRSVIDRAEKLLSTWNQPYVERIFIPISGKLAKHVISKIANSYRFDKKYMDILKLVFL